MKPFPNESTSPAKKSIVVGIFKHGGATVLRFGMVHVYNNVRSNLVGFKKNLSFFCSSSWFWGAALTL